MQKTNNESGFVLATTLVAVLIIVITAGAFVSMMINEANSARHQRDSTKAFFAAEAGGRWSIYSLRNAGTGNTGLMPLDTDGEYEVNVSGDVIRSAGYFPTKAAAQAGRGAKRTIDIEVILPTPSEFYNGAIVVSNLVDLNGNYTVTGDVIYGSNIEDTGSGTITGTSSQQDWCDPLPRLNFEQLRNIAVSQIKSNGQNNLYTAADVAADKPYPTNFYFRTPGTNGVDDPGEPNVVYIETNLVLNGNVGILCGFFVVVGDVITNPNGTWDTTINGNGTIDGCVYTLGNFRINGGGNGFGVTGGVWAGDEARLNGNADVTYNAEYMEAIDFLDIDFELQIVSWQERPDL